MFTSIELVMKADKSVYVWSSLKEVQQVQLMLSNPLCPQ